MREFKFTDPKLPAWVRDVADHGKARLYALVPHNGRASLDDMGRLDCPTVRVMRRDTDNASGGATRVVVAYRSGVREDEPLWWYGRADGYGYDRLAAAMAGPTIRTPDGGMWTFSRDCCVPVPGATRLILSGLDGMQRNSHGRWVEIQ